MRRVFSALFACFLFTGCAASDKALFDSVLRVAEVRCDMPKIKVTQRDAYVQYSKTVELKPEHRYDDNVRLHEFMHYVSLECLTMDQREELLARYAPYYIIKHKGLVR